MKPLYRYATNALIYAAVMYCIEALLLPAQRSAPRRLAYALVWGCVMQLIAALRDSNTVPEVESDRPWVLVIGGLVLFTGAIACYFGSSTPPVIGESLFLVVLAGAGVLGIWQGSVLWNKQRYISPPTNL